MPIIENFLSTWFRKSSLRVSLSLMLITYQKVCILDRALASLPGGIVAMKPRPIFACSLQRLVIETSYTSLCRRGTKSLLSEAYIYRHAHVNILARASNI